MAKSVLLSPVLYPVYQNTAPRAEKLPTLVKRSYPEGNRHPRRAEKFCL
ncbi:hypothetical protein QT982_31075 [Microcoleus sp. herbarium2]